MVFVGEYEVTMDAKGRFLVPAAFKKQLAADTANQFVITGALKNASLYILCKHGNHYLLK